MLGTLTPVLGTIKNWALDIRNALGIGTTVTNEMATASALFDRSAQEIIDAASSVGDAAIELDGSSGAVRGAGCFLDRIDSKIFTNREDGAGLSQVAQRRKDRDERRFRAIQDEFFGGQESIDKYTVPERLTALGELEALTDDL